MNFSFNIQVTRGSGLDFYGVRYKELFHSSGVTKNVGFRSSSTECALFDTQRPAWDGYNEEDPLKDFTEKRRGYTMLK
jgi:hypothetical protein